MNQEYAVYLGGPCIDEYYEVCRWPEEGDKFNGRFKGHVAGGMLANAACVMAGYGMKTYCFTSMGRDETLDFLLQDLESHHVDTSYVDIQEGKLNTKCIIFQGREERTILCVAGDEWSIRLTPEQMEFLAGAKYIYTSLQMFALLEDAAEVFCALKERGVRLVLDHEASTYIPNWRDYMRYCYLASMNEHGIESLAEGRTEEALLDELFRLGVQIVVKTLGKKGCEVVTRQERFGVPVYDVPVVDTTGAGDTFNSSFVYGLHRGMTLRGAARFATAAANRSITIQGPRSGVAAEKEILQFIREHGSQGG